MAGHPHTPHTGIQPGEFALSPTPDTDVCATAPDVLQAYMPLGRGEFRATDLSVADRIERMKWLVMRTRMVRDRSETPEAREYFDGIQAAFMASFEEVTPDMLADSTQMNFVKCVDKYTHRQLDALNVPEDAQTRLPGGLAWFDMTGLMVDWAVPRVLNPQLVAGMHRNCGGIAIKGGLTGEDQAMHRNRAEENAKRVFLEAAALVSAYYIRKQGRHFDPEVADMLSNWGGPNLIISTGESGTAEPFVTPKSVRPIDIDEHYTPRELIDGVDAVLNRMHSERSLQPDAEAVDAQEHHNSGSSSEG